MGNIREEVLTHGGPNMYLPGREYQGNNSAKP